MRASSSQQLQLSLLGNLGVPRDQLSQIRDQLHKTDQLAINGHDQVALGTLQRAAASVEAHLKKSGQRFVPLPTEALHRLLGPVPGDTLHIGLDEAFPSASVSAADPVQHAASLDAEVSPAQLGKAAQATQAYLQKAAPELAQALGEGQATVKALATALGTAEARKALGSQLDVAMQALGTVGGPGHTSRDVQVNLDSNYTALDGGTGAGEVGVFQKRMIEYMTVKRDKTRGEFTMHAFEADKLVVTVPPGATVLLLDSGGNQTGARIRPQATKIGEQSLPGVSISRSMVQPPDRKMYTTGAQFGVRVIDKEGAVLYERNLSFDKKASQTSKRIFSGKLEAQQSPDPALTELWDQYRPDARANPVGVGQRPSFTVDGQTGDRVRIQRDGKNFDLNQWVQFLAAPRHSKQAFKVDKGFVQLEPSNKSHRELDDPEYDATAGGRLKDSHGHGITFDRSLHMTRQARWGSQGLQVLDSGMRAVQATFDPLHDAR